MKLIFTCACLVLLMVAKAQPDSLAIYYQLSISTYKDKNYEDFLRYTRQANDLRPNHPSLSYNLACAYALNDEKVAAVDALKQYLQMNASMAFAEDTDLQSLRGFPPFDQLTGEVDALLRSEEKSVAFLKTSQTGHHFESITYDSRTSGLLIGSVRSRSVLRLHQGKQEVLVDSASDPGIFAVMGLDIDEEKNLLWICTAALPEMSGYADSLKNKSSVFALDLSTGILKSRYAISDATAGDLVVAKNGSVYVSDGLRNRIYKVNPEGVTVMKDLPSLFNLQGLALDPSEANLYIADYITGLYKLELSSGLLTRIRSNGLYSEKGIDGLLFYRDHLIAIQNGTSPKRVWMGRLSSGQTAIRDIALIDQHVPGSGEPTQGVIVGDALYYLSNSAWDSYEKGTYIPERTEDLTIRKAGLIPLLIE